jgi:drug/metabolite transporter (DMT)-like permease
LAGVFFVVFACALWALDTLIRYPLVGKGIDPVVIVTFEHAFLTACFLPTLFRGIPRAGELKVADVASFLIIGGLGSAFATVCFTEAFRYLNPSMVILLQKFQPVVAVSLAAIVLKEPLPRPFFIWGAVSLLGALLVSSPDIVKVWSVLSTNPAGLASDVAIDGYGLVAISVLCWGAATVFGKRLSMVGFEPGAIMAGRFFTGMVVLCFIAPWGQDFIFADPTDYGRLLVMGVMMLVAMLAYYRGLQRLPAKVCAVVELFFPLMAVVLNWFILGSQLTEVQLAGGALLALGAFVLQLKKY